MSVKPVISIIDYGAGNLLSLTRAIEHCGATAVLVSNSHDINNAERLILPGVGAFKKGMNSLEENKLIEAIIEYGNSGRQLLGICLGMQMLFEMSEEFGNHNGLGLISGVIRKIPVNSKHERKVPHIGWNKILLSSNRTDWEDSIMNGIKYEEFFYFVHSYSAEPDESSNRLADCDYDGVRLSAVVKKNNISGCQFHPEKSGPTGLKLIKNFCYLDNS